MEFQQYTERCTKNCEHGSYEYKTKMKINNTNKHQQNGGGGVLTYSYNSRRMRRDLQQ